MANHLAFLNFLVPLITGKAKYHLFLGISSDDDGYVISIWSGSLKVHHTEGIL